MASLAFSIDKLMKQKQQQKQADVKSQAHDVPPALLSPPPSPQQLQQFLLNNYWRQMMLPQNVIRPPPPPSNIATGPLWTQMWLQQQNQMRNMQQFAPTMQTSQDVTLFNAYNQYIYMLQQQEQRHNVSNQQQQQQRTDSKKMAQHAKVSKYNKKVKMETKRESGMTLCLHLHQLLFMNCSDTC
jgi:hypothetical protein